MEIYMDQDLSRIYHEPFLLVFLYFRKAYYTLDCWILLKIMEGYRAGPKLRSILAESFENQKVVTRQIEHYGP